MGVVLIRHHITDPTGVRMVSQDRPCGRVMVAVELVATEGIEWNSPHQQHLARVEMAGGGVGGTESKTLALQIGNLPDIAVLPNRDDCLIR